jgi:peptidoglycan/LPS O-acetylase OafA/YrhL
MDRRNVSLDTLRGAAIVFVINCHIAHFAARDGHLGFVQLGGRGVDLFFVLSGWLLGFYLLTELKQTGTIQLRRFWLRRWLRTLPAYYAMLAFTLAWQYFRFGVGSLHWEYLVFLQNYLPDIETHLLHNPTEHIPYFTISWSLCVEEYFYLAVAPLLLLFARVPRSRLLLVPLLLLPIVCRAAGWYGSTEQTHVRFGQCAAGVLLAAVAIHQPVLWRWLCRAAPVLALAGLVAAITNVVARFHPKGSELWMEAWTLVFSSFVLLANSNDFWRWQARVPGCRFIAERSYALYLVHGEALALVSRLLDRLKIQSLPLSYLLSWTIALLLAEILYRAIERPFMRAREWFDASRSLRLTTPTPVESAPESLEEEVPALAAEILPGSGQ